MPGIVELLGYGRPLGEAVEQYGRHLGITEDAWLFAEGEIGGYRDGSAFVEAADQMEEKLAADLAKGR